MRLVITLGTAADAAWALRLASAALGAKGSGVDAKEPALANPNKPTRPISPHATIYRIGPHMLVSFVHRLTGSGMATVGTILLLWWLAALGGGEASYAGFRGWFATDKGLNPFGWIIGVGLTLALFQHLASGLRHFFLDEGALFELKRNRLTAQLTMVFSILATAAFWLLIWSKTHG